MNLVVDPGTYILAVSGGVDSMVLLDLLRQMPDVSFTVAHFDHGIRSDSAEDRKLVQETAHRHGLPFVYDQGMLGAHASEAAAREARYKFLNHVKTMTGARAIITAHHQDDAIETAVINMLRGGGRLGLTSLKTTDGIIRPLLQNRKHELIEYAHANNVAWREDSTNQNQEYLRNYVRHSIIPRMTAEQRQELLGHINRMHGLNEQINNLLTHHLHVQPAHDVLDRKAFIKLPHGVAREVLTTWLRKHWIINYDRKTIERLVTAIKTMSPGTTTNITGKYSLRIGKDQVTLLVR